MFVRTMMLAAAAALVVDGPALAQDDPSPPPQNCQARPAPDHSNDAKPVGGLDPGRTGSISPDKLTPCDGVLRPPDTGDQMAQPPPATGAMREVKPGELPGQQSNPLQQ